MLKCCHCCSTFLSLLCSLCHRSDFHPCRMYDCTGVTFTECSAFLPISPWRNTLISLLSSPGSQLTDRQQTHPCACRHTQTSQMSIPGPALTLERERKGLLSLELSVCRVHPSQLCRIHGRLTPGWALAVSLSQLWGSSGVMKGKRSILRWVLGCSGQPGVVWGGGSWDHWLLSLLLFSLSSLQSFLSFPLPWPSLPSFSWLFTSQLCLSMSSYGQILSRPHCRCCSCLLNTFSSPSTSQTPSYSDKDFRLLFALVHLALGGPAL